MKITPRNRTSPNIPSYAQGTRNGFTLIELLVVIAIIAILAAVLLPVLHQAQLRGETAACIDHQKQLAAAWIMYSQDNNDYLAGNDWGDEKNWNPPSRPPENWISGWLDPSGTVGGQVGDEDNTNWDLLTDSKYASMGDYVKNAKIFICPSCILRVFANKNAGGGPRIYPCIRSVSMNCWMGYVCNPNPVDDAQTNEYREFHKITQITTGLSPSDAFVFIEERGESIDDGSFWTGIGITRMENWPTGYHNNAATVGFADGHVEVHRWRGDEAGSPYTCTTPQNPTPAAKWGTESVGSSCSDLAWLQQHATYYTLPGRPPTGS